MISIGRAIGNSNCVRSVEVWSDNPRSQQQSFLVHLADNRSIEHLKLHRSIDFDCTVLAPFLEQNINLRSICCTDSISPTLISVMSQSKMNRLARIDFRGSELSDKSAAELFSTLNVMPGLENLLDVLLEDNMIAHKGCIALCALLDNSDCRMISLGLADNNIDDGCVGVLIGGLINCSSLRSLSFGLYEPITSVGWKLFSVYLSHPECLLQKLILNPCRPGNACAAALGGSLAKNGTLNYLDFRSNEFTDEWREIFRCLVSPSALTELNLNDSSIDDEGAFDLFSVLATNATLKKLILKSAHEISSVGWVACFQRLLYSQSALEILNFAHNAIDDEGASVLATLLGSHMSTVVSLNLKDNYSITANGIRKFVNVLSPSSTSKLKILRLRSYAGKMNDNLLIDFIAALSNNNSLNELDLGGSDVSVRTLDALVNILCDKTSIANVCSSNHSLNIFHPDFYAVVDGSDVKGWRKYKLESLLKMNRNTDKAEVIRTKLLTFIFSDVDNIVRVFGSMDMSMMPDVMEWIGRDRLGRSVMFELCRKMPELFQE